MAEEHQTAVYQLRKKDPSRDVVVFLVLNTPPGALEGRGWKDFGSHQKWNETYLPQVAGVREKFEVLGAKVLVRRKLPQKDTDDALYYQVRNKEPRKCSFV